MEKILKVVVILLLSFGCSYMIYDSVYVDYRRTYCGYVQDKFISNPYEQRSGRTTYVAAAKFYVIFKPDTFQFKQIDVNVNTYYSATVGSRTCFDFRPSELTK